MFKSLIATVLLSVSCSGGALKHQEIKMPNYLSTVREQGENAYVLYGGYCWKDTFDYIGYTGDGETCIVYSLEGTHDFTVEYNLPRALYFNVGNPSADRYDGFYDLSISTDGDGFWYIALNGTYYDFGVWLDESTDFYIDDIDDVRYAKCIFWFPYQVYVDRMTYNFFNQFFSGYGNTYTVLYTGYYALPSDTLSTSLRWQYYGYSLVDNVLYSTVLRSQTPVILARGDGGEFYIYRNGYKVKSRNILIQNALINKTAYVNMQTDGVFMFVRDETSYTFGDMVFSVMDAPVYFLSQLFSFELFGIQFYVAFMSIVTVLLICVVLRKII